MVRASALLDGITAPVEIGFSIQERMNCISSSRRRVFFWTRTTECVGDRMELALVTPGASGEFPVALAIGPAKKGGGIGHRIAPFKVSVPLSALTFLDEGGRRKAVVDRSEEHTSE